MIVCAAQFLENPGPEFFLLQKASTKPVIRRQTEEFNSLEMLRTPQFYVLYAMMLMMGIGGLMVTAQVAPVAGSLKIGAAMLTLALTLNPLANGAGRVFWGWVSDHLGREWTMFVAFVMQSLSLLSVLTWDAFPSGGSWCACRWCFFRGARFMRSFLRPAADFFGAKHSSSNYSFLYSSKGVASIVGGGLAATLFEKTGTWNTAFYGSAVLALCASLMGFVLRAMPLPSKHVTAAAEMAMKPSLRVED